MNDTINMNFMNFTDDSLGENSIDDFVTSNPEISPLTETQGKILALLPIIPSMLSIFGSSMIIHLVVQQANRKMTPYRRLLLGMSICDIINSLFLPFSTFLLPRESSQRPWTFGNDKTCTMLGFAAQLSFSGILYNTMISYYFLLTIRFAMKENDISKYIEPIMHIFSIGYPAITAFIGVGFGMFHQNEIGATCWVSDYPEGCGSENGVEKGDEDYISCQSDTIAWIFGGTIMIFLIFSLIMNNALIFSYVRSTIIKGQRRYAHGTATSSSNNGQDSQSRRIRAVATQAFLYVAACIVTYSWSIILRILEGGFSFDAEQEGKLYPLLVAQLLCFPLQGFFNFLIYIRPRYLTIRKKNQNQTRWWAFCQTLTPEGQTLQHSTVSSQRRRSTTTRWDFSGSMKFLSTRRRPEEDSRDFQSNDLVVISIIQDATNRNTNNDSSNNNANTIHDDDYTSHAGESSFLEEQEDGDPTTSNK